MERLIEEIRACVGDEYERAAEKFGECFNSWHEMYAVLLEEFQEAQKEIEAFENAFDTLWLCVKENDYEFAETCLGRMRERVENALCELVQCAAMIFKAGYKRCDKPESEG